MGTERRHCRSRNIGTGEGKEGVLFSIFVSSVSFFCDVQNGGGGFLHITAGSDVSLGIDSWLDIDVFSFWPLLAYDTGGSGMCVELLSLIITLPYYKIQNKSFFNMSNIHVPQ